MNICLHWTVLLLNDQIEPSVLMESDLPQVLSSIVYSTGADLGGGGRTPPLSYMKNDVMRTVIYAAFCMLPSLDLQDCTSF